MRRLGLVLVCGLAACGKGKSGAAQGSAVTPAPATPADATVTATADASIDASAQVTAAPTLSAKGGLSTLGRFDWSKQDEDATAELLQSKVGLPGVKVSFDVMDVPGEVEREEGYWSVKRGDTEIMQLLRTSGERDTNGPLAVIVWTADVPTADGIKVGDTVGAVLAKHPDLTCSQATIAETVAADIACRSAAEKQLGYIVNAKKAKVKPGKVNAAKISNVDIVGISHEF